MREDIQYVVIERPRVGRKGSEQAVRRNRRRSQDSLSRGDFDSLPSKQSMGRRRQYGWNSKELSDFLNPIRGFLHKNVGRPWDKVYSEIREHLNANSTTHAHVLQHLDGFVETNIRMDIDTGVPLCPSYRNYAGGPSKGWFPFVSISAKRDSYYVNPITGLLCRAPHYPQPPPQKKIEGYRTVPSSLGFDQVIVRKGTPYVKEDGIWYSCVMAQFPLGYGWGVSIKKKRRETRFNYDTKLYHEVLVTYTDTGPVDMFLGSTGGPSRGNRKSAVKAFYGTTEMYCSKKGHQLSSRELRHLGLENEK